MERRDIIVIAGALIVVLILAIVVKPMLTGQAPNLGLPQTPAPSGSTGQGVPSTVQEMAGPTEVQLATETPAPSGTISAAESTNTGPGQEKPLPSPTAISWQPNADNPMPAVQMVDYADIVGKYTGNTAPFRIPTPYWEISYNVTPSGSSPVFMMDVLEKGTQGEKDKTIRSLIYRPGKQMDPMEGRFFEGGRDYYLNITADQVEKYRIIVSIPLKYIPDN